MFDLIIENAEILDGSGKESYKGDIGIKGEVIEKIGNLSGAEAARRVDAAGRTPTWRSSRRTTRVSFRHW
jgi:N-acyl-D-amino-acid deacylase